MIKKIMNYVSEDGWKWAVVVVALCALATVGKSYLITSIKTGTHDSFDMNDCLFEMSEVNHALEQLGAGQIAEARRILVMRLNSMTAKINAQIEESDSATRFTAIMGLMRVAQAQQAHPQYYATGWSATVSDAEKQVSFINEERPHKPAGEVAVSRPKVDENN